MNKKSHTPYYLGAAVEKLLAERPALATRNPASWADNDEHELIRLYAVYRATLSFKAQGQRPTMAGMEHGNERVGKILDAFRKQGVKVDWLPDPTGKKRNNWVQLAARPGSGAWLFTLPMYLRAAFVKLGLATWLAVTAPPGLAQRQRPAPPRHQYLRVNDTLQLEVSRPYATFTTYGQESPTWLWQRAELRGRRSYRQQLTNGSGNDLVTLYGAQAGAGGTLLRLSYWRDPHHLPPPRPAPHNLDESDDAAFGCRVWDVRYRTWGWFYDANLRELGTRNDDHPAGFKGTAFGFTGGFYEGYDERGLYYLLPHWLAAEQARVRRTHRLPPPARLAAYLEQAEVHDLLEPSYRPLLAQLLRAYAACPMPAATARQVALARQALARAR